MWGLNQLCLQHVPTCNGQPTSICHPPPERLQFHVDFAGPALAALPPDAAVEAVASSQDDSRIVAVRTEHHPALAGWRMTLEVERRLDRAVELRAFLRHGDDTLTETWTYALPPQP